MTFSTKTCATALASIFLSSCFTVGTCDNTTTTTIVPLTSSDDLSVFVDGKVYQRQKHVVDPWIRPPRGKTTQQAIGMAGDFDGYPRIIASPFDDIEFLMRPIVYSMRKGTFSNKQRHGVYVITEKQLVQDYLDGKSEHPCGEPVYTAEDLCQVVEYQGLNATDCPSRETLFPLLEIFGDSGVIGYTVTELGSLAEQYGVATGNGSLALAFDCPWIQKRNEEGSGGTSHCIGGMFVIVEVSVGDEVLVDDHDDHEEGVPGMDDHDGHDHSEVEGSTESGATVPVLGFMTMLTSAVFMM